MQLIHYGHSDFNIAKFKPIKNDDYGWVKPNGGLWTSPLESNWGWKDWCISEGFHSYTDDTIANIKCVIPKGSIYYYNPYDKQYVSNQLIFGTRKDII